MNMGSRPGREGRWTVLSTCSTEPDSASEQLAEGKATTYLVGRPGFQASLGLNFSLCKMRELFLYSDLLQLQFSILGLGGPGLGLREAGVVREEKNGFPFFTTGAYFQALLSVGGKEGAGALAQRLWPSPWEGSLEDLGLEWGISKWCALSPTTT